MFRLSSLAIFREYQYETCTALLYRFFFHGPTALVVLSQIIVEVSRSHSDTPHSVGLLWTSDRPVAETSTWQHTHKRKTSMPPAGFEPVIPASEHPQTHALDRAATGIGFVIMAQNHQNICVQCYVNIMLKLLHHTTLTEIFCIQISWDTKIS
jgi:hypothetical protein